MMYILTHNGDFYYNTGPLDSNGILLQLLDILLSYETIGVNINELVGDRGGSNTKILAVTLCILASLVLPDAKLMYFINPYDQRRYIYTWSCSIHSLKARRNTLYRSQVKLSRGLKKSNVLFGWKQTTETYPRDEEREHSNLGRRTNIAKHTVTLDNICSPP